jgi:hypothetical protein
MELLCLAPALVALAVLTVGTVALLWAGLSLRFACEQELRRTVLRATPRELSHTADETCNKLNDTLRRTLIARAHARQCAISTSGEMITLTLTTDLPFALQKTYQCRYPKPQVLQ